MEKKMVCACWLLLVLLQRWVDTSSFELICNGSPVQITLQTWRNWTLHIWWGILRTCIVKQLLIHMSLMCSEFQARVREQGDALWSFLTILIFDICQGLCCKTFDDNSSVRFIPSLHCVTYLLVLGQLIFENVPWPDQGTDAASI